MLHYLLRGITVVTLALFAASTAKASLEHCSKKQAPRRELVCAQRALRARQGEERWIRANKTRTLFALNRAHYWRSHLRFVLWRERVDRRHVVEARARFVPSVGHLALWLCIHSGEGSWTDEGAPYYGGLQMTYGWAGLVGDAAQLSPMQQMEAAETGYRRSGYSQAWLFGQWPNTAPPCSALA